MRNYEVIKNQFDELKEKYGLKNEDLVNDGAVYYMNGNDGTDFDWQVNDRACEFMTFHKKSEVGALRVLFHKDGTETIFYYKDGEWTPEATEKRESPVDAEELVAYLYGTFDCHDIWDQPITDWNFPEYQLLPDDEEEEE